MLRRWLRVRQLARPPIDTRVRTASEISERLGLPLLGRVPAQQDSGRRIEALLERDQQRRATHRPLGELARKRPHGALCRDEKAVTTALAPLSANIVKRERSLATRLVAVARQKARTEMQSWQALDRILKS